MGKGLFYIGVSVVAARQKRFARYQGRVLGKHVLLQRQYCDIAPSDNVSLHNEVGRAPPPCAPPYVRRVRISGTLDFLIHSAPDSSFFCDAPPRVRQLGQPFPLQSFFFPNDLFSDWFSFFSVHLCSFSKFSFIALVKNFYCRSLIPRHVFYPYASHWSTTRAAV
jgi:hypothetical protein